MSYCVCYCVDDDIKSNKLLLCSLFSLKEHNKDLEVKILTFNSNKFIKYYKQYNNIEIIDVRDIYKNKYEKIGQKYYQDLDGEYRVFRPDITNMTYFRLEIPLLLNKYDKVLYLDTDTEIKKDLTDIFNLDLGDYEIYGQPNHEPHLDEVKRDLWVNYIDQFDDITKDKTDYICSGILLMNINLLNKKDYNEFLNNLLEFEYNHYDIHAWKDEFLINCSMKCKTNELLDSEYEEEYKELNYNETNSYIVHYIWKYKDNLLKKYDFLLKDLDI